MAKQKSVSAENFIYSKFSAELAAKLKESHESLESVSINRLFKSKNYLSNALKLGALPLNVILALCEWYGLQPKDYEPVKEPVKKAVKASKDEGWTCEIKIEEDFGTAMLRIMKNGETISVGRSFLYGTDNTGVIQSISYAAHMCYKLAQQGTIAEISEAPKIASYKEWLMSYEKANNVFGALARWVKNHYKTFPSNGKKDMHVYLLQNGGGDHINAFKVSFDNYLDWYDKQKKAATCGNR